MAMLSGACTTYRRFLLVGGALFVLLAAIGAALEARFLRATTLGLAEREGALLGRHLGAIYFKPGAFLDSAGDLRIPSTLPGGVQEELQALGIVMLKVYDMRGKIVAATDPAYVGMEKGGNASFRAALNGRTVVNVASRKDYRNLYGRNSTQDLLEFYVPLWSPGRNAPEVVLEFYRPWALYQPLIREGIVRITVVTVVLSGLYFLLLVLFVGCFAPREVPAVRAGETGTPRPPPDEPRPDRRSP